eukprot:CAMPEP_0197019320 /NCGR_PEP_ID=MMETSP1380-20130617/80630_1 /TAXON_ID=5936 /ORGANISM="Euplotes crassus, Strain CT5" /LENGTH=48 /DNA_ID= /DNA_START= /DNA_END= /DNA_ORIENTATION=
MIQVSFMDLVMPHVGKSKEQKDKSDTKDKKEGKVKKRKPITEFDEYSF